MIPYLYNLGLRLENVAAGFPEKTALWFSSNLKISYHQLNSAANRIARSLLTHDIGQNRIVCISGTKVPVIYSALIACLKIGAGYVILDPDSPSERLSKIIDRCQPQLILTEPLLAGKLNAIRPEIAEISIDMKVLEQAASSLDNSNLSSTLSVTGTQISYIMFTSGSTGFPKGAVMTHANVLNLIDWARVTYAITPEDVCTNLNPLYFDNSVFDIYSSLFNGATLAVFSKDETRDPGKIVAKIADAQCSQWFSVPSLLIFMQTMKATDGKHLRSIKRFIFGGEGYPKAKLKQLFDAYKDTASLHNVYGPTECTCICSSYRLSEPDFANIAGLPPLGAIAPNFSYLILDENNTPVRDDCIGELCLAGPNVGRGYYNDPEQTARAFVQNPVNTLFPETIYRTGDMARFNPADGKLYIHGRKDNQIKHMGYRIELEEIDAGMHCLPYVNEAVALHTQVDGLSRIIAVVALRGTVNDETFCSDLQKILPDYMIPQSIHRMKMLPKNANGKVDRKTLSERAVAGALAKEDSDE
jgi:D-alanine--poly(phosphoribitol) ligase subunit 1